MQQLRVGQTATALADGTVLIAGGETIDEIPTADELYDTTANLSSPIMGLAYGLYAHTATPIESGPEQGEVLIVGGSDIAPPLNQIGACQAQAAFPIPISRLYSAAGMENSTLLSPTSPRSHHTATLLADGTTVLVTGGVDEKGKALDTAEFYDSTNGTWTQTTGKMNFPRQAHAAILLSDGSVLIAGGCDRSQHQLASAERYYPHADKFSEISPMRSARAALTLTALNSGEVLVAGGSGNSKAELYDPSTGRFVPTGSMVEVLSGPTSTLLDDGQVLITSGGSVNAELYNPSSGHFMLAGSMSISLSNDAATLLSDGNVLVTGGLEGTSGDAIASTEIYQATATPPGFVPGGDLNTPRGFHTATLLNGGILIVGGLGLSTALSSTEVYALASSSFSQGSPMNEPRVGHTATLLATGKVLVAGGRNTAVSNTAETYQVATGSFAYTGPMTTARSGHTATMLGDQTVLIAGGSSELSEASLSDHGALDTAEIYNPSTGSFTATAQTMRVARTEHTATLLDDTEGRVLITGGADGQGRTLASAEIYNPSNGSFTATGRMHQARRDHGAALLSDGEVLITGGWDANRNSVATAELYDPTKGKFADAPAMNEARAYQSVSVFDNGEVLVAGGDALQDAEIYDLDQNIFTIVTRSNFTAGAGSAAAKLLNGDMLVTGGGAPVSKVLGHVESTNRGYLFLPASGLAPTATPAPTPVQ